MKTFKLLSALVLLSQLTACGIDESASSLKAPPVQVYTFNGSGANGATDKMKYMLSDCAPAAASLSLCENATVKGDSLVLGNLGVHQGSFIVGPYLTFQPAAAGVGHISAEVEIEPLEGTGTDGVASTVVVDLVSRGPNGLATLVHDTQIVNFQKGSGKILVGLGAKPFHEALVDVEVRVRDLTTTANIMQFRFAPILQVNYTRIIYN